MPAGPAGRLQLLRGLLLCLLQVLVQRQRLSGLAAQLQCRRPAAALLGSECPEWQGRYLGQCPRLSSAPRPLMPHPVAPAAAARCEEAGQECPWLLAVVQVLVLQLALLLALLSLLLLVLLLQVHLQGCRSGL